MAKVAKIKLSTAITLFKVEDTVIGKVIQKEVASSYIIDQIIGVTIYGSN